MLLFLGGVRLPELTPLAKILLSLVYFAFIIVLKRLLLNDEDSGSGLLGLFSRKERGAGSFRSFTESKEQEMRRKAKAFAMPAEELAFARCVAAARLAKRGGNAGGGYPGSPVVQRYRVYPFPVRAGERKDDAGAKHSDRSHSRCGSYSFGSAFRGPWYRISPSKIILSAFSF